MHFVEKPGTSIEAMHRVTVRASKDLRALRDDKGVQIVRNFGSHIGRAEVADEPVGPNFTELWISVDPDTDYKTAVKKIEEVVYAYPGLYRDVLTYLRERIKEVLTGASATVVVRLYGPDHDALRAKGKEVEAAMGTVAGVTNLKVETQVNVAQIDVRLKPEAAKKFGLTAGPHPACIDDSSQGLEGRRGLRRAEEVRCGGVGRARACVSTRPRCRRCRSTHRPECKYGLAMWPMCSSSRRRTRFAARTRAGGSTSRAM